MEGLEVMGLKSNKLEKDGLKGFVYCQEKIHLDLTVLPAVALVHFKIS